MKHTRSVISFGPNGYVIQHDDTPLLPGMGKPEFGGVQLRPGMDSRRAYTGPQMGLFDQPATATQERMLDDAGILTQL